MMCHSALVVRHLLTEPGQPYASLRPARLTGRIASLKWSRPAYVKRLSQMMGKEVDYAARPAEDFASLTIEFETADGQDRKSTRLNSSHGYISYAVFCLKKKK